ncbi:hypothetical protein ZOSMA_721G00020 [Zostera marina]|uniref:DUF7866 domain-containing protein n=1 Tax=Zostera marina TaxID=29655 RepID=A0A0K9NSF9_ZOSMR|nr:hypothetical protein ZOSMA_721G00020 [Zostera marina]
MFFLTLLKTLILLVICLLLSRNVFGIEEEYVPQDGSTRFVNASNLKVMLDVGVLSPMEEPFSVCSKCTCCASANHKDCHTAKCCHELNCNLPNKPFGTCAFQPVDCNCDNCKASLSLIS